MFFWIVTPSYRHLTWLKRCLDSVRDQAGEGLRVHHHVQDAMSPDGTPAYLRDVQARHADSTSGYSFSFSSEPDDGMYDAINRGWLLAPGDVDVIAHLNCDEQYLPGALLQVARAFECHPAADVLLADMVVVDRDMNYICHRRSLQPYAWLSRWACAASTVATFQRGAWFRSNHVLFDTTWKNIGDMAWYNALHGARARFEVSHDLVAAFADTGENLNWNETARQEHARYAIERLGGRARLMQLGRRIQGLRRMMLEWVLIPPRDYEVYRHGGEDRVRIAIEKPTGLWHKTL